MPYEPSCCRRDAGKTERASSPQHQVACRCQKLRGVSAPHAAGILAHGYVADVVQPVLDPPGATIEFEQPGRVGLVGAEAGDPVRHLDGLVTLLPPRG
jgi:hypothetical protein